MNSRKSSGSGDGLHKTKTTYSIGAKEMDVALEEKRKVFRLPYKIK